MNAREQAIAALDALARVHRGDIGYPSVSRDAARIANFLAEGFDMETELVAFALTCREDARDFTRWAMSGSCAVNTRIAHLTLAQVARTTARVLVRLCVVDRRERASQRAA